MMPMSRSLVAALLLISLALAVPFSAWASTIFSADFEGAAVGSIPSPWTLNSSNSTTSAAVASGYAGNATRVLGLHDSNTNTDNNHLRITFPQCTRGTCTLQFDACFASIHAGFGMRITNGGVVTSGGNWLAAVKFEGDLPYATGGTVGTLSYQEYASGAYSYTPASPSVAFAGGTWYTVKIEANLDTKAYQIYFGPRGGALARVTPAAGIPLINLIPSGGTTTAGGASFFSSQKREPAGDIYIDNVTVTSNAESPNTIAEAKKLPLGSCFPFQDMVVTGGTDQMTGPFFYIADSIGGIRVRSSAVVRQGDRVSIYGAVGRANDAGVAALRNGEREINAVTLTTTYGPFPMPKPVGITNHIIGGGPFGPIDSDGYPCQPGVWASGTGATSGFDQISEVGLNNIGRLCRVWGKVVYADDANRFFYIDDGSEVRDGGALANGAPSPVGVRVLAPAGVPLTAITGKYATVTGIVGSVAASDAGSPQGSGGSYIRNVRVIRPTCEPFLDLNLNGFWDPGEPIVDTNANGGYDGIQIAGVPSANVRSGFDRYGTAIVNGAPFLLKGIYIYSVDTPTLDEMVRQNFSAVMCFDMNPGLLADIGAHGLKTMPCLREAGMRPSWMAAQSDPAILGWYTHDEPEGQGVSAAQALIDYQWVKSQDPTHFAGESHFLLNGFNDYKAADDFAISDCYPLTDPSATIIPMADILSFTKGVHGGCYYPAYQFVQLFGAAPQVLPTPTQVRAMTYLALAFQARGIMYFSYQRLNSQWWDDWAEVKTLNGEMDQFRSFLLMPWVPVDATTSNEAVRIGGIRVGGSALIITVNVTSSTQTATFNLPGIDASSLTLPLEGGATQPLVNRSFTGSYAPYQTRVFVWGDIPPAP